MAQEAGEPADEVGEKTARFPVLRTLLVGTLGLFLTWAVVSYSFVAYLADANPDRALAIRRDPVAALNFVDRELARIKSEPNSSAQSAQPEQPAAGDSNAERLRALAGIAAKTLPGAAAGADTSQPMRSPEQEALYQRVREALRTDPLSAKGLRLLAQLSEGYEPKEEVANLMRMAVARNLHEAQALFWLMMTAANAGAFTDAITYADAVLRTQSRLSQQAIGVFARASDTPEGLAEVRRLVLANPPWRQIFFSVFSRSVTDGRIPLQLLLDLKDTPYPPTSREIGDYMSVLLENRLFELAYYAWLQFLPPGQLAMVATPFNGSFEMKPSGLPFDWTLPKSAGVTTEIVARPGEPDKRALLVEFGIGRLDFAGVTQVLLLPSGPYRFSAAYQGQVTGRRGLVWQVTCFGGKELGRTQMILGTAAAWTPVEFAFTVPETDCPAQQVRLFHDARSASEQLVSGKSFHDDVRIERVETQ
ncbi:MAG: hypothetical protein EKK41_10770 [Hyphomicrobiales bacterium]|nr:MAG: hypothetical protein EKK41_10770 [Hyphomicrobiales bacterium]